MWYRPGRSPGARGLRPRTRQGRCPLDPQQRHCLCEPSIGGFLERGLHRPYKVSVGPSPRTHQNEWFQGPLSLAGFQGAAPLGSGSGVKPRRYPRTASATPANVSANAKTCRGPSVSPSTNVEPSTPTIGETSTVVAAIDAGTSRRARNHARYATVIGIVATYVTHAQPAGVTRVQSAVSNTDSAPSTAVPSPTCQATLVAGGNASGVRFASTVPRPNN